MTRLSSKVNPRSAEFLQNAAAMQAVVDDLNAKVQQIKLGGGEALIARHTSRGKLFVRDRIQKLLDPGSPFLEIGQFAAWQCYDDYVPAAGVVAG
ncbi:MAG: carboxyl transferase domain-containing protein, partial [Rheinheimera sp.]